MVANYASGKRRFDSYATESDALEAAGRLARQLSERDVVAAAMTNEQAADYAAAVQTLAPFNLALPATVSTLAECLKLVGDLPNLHAAAKFYAARHKTVTPKPVADVVAELVSAEGTARRVRPLPARPPLPAGPVRRRLPQETPATSRRRRFKPGWTAKSSRRSPTRTTAASRTCFSSSPSPAASPTTTPWRRRRT